MSRKHWKRHGCGWGARWGSGPSTSAAWDDGQGHHGRNFRILSGLRRDPYRGRVSGVCAGIAGYYGINLKLIRIAMVVALLINPLLTIGGYALATWLIQPMEPAEPRADGGQSEVNAGSSAERARREREAEEELPPELRFAALKDKFRELEERTGAAETLVTSSEFRLRRDFKNMGEGQSDADKADEGGASSPRFGAGPSARPPMMGLIG